MLSEVLRSLAGGKTRARRLCLGSIGRNADATMMVVAALAVLGFASVPAAAAPIQANIGVGWICDWTTTPQQAGYSMGGSVGGGTLTVMSI